MKMKVRIYSDQVSLLAWNKEINFPDPIVKSPTKTTQFQYVSKDLP